ncbi:MAG TPA: RICIN domain-containing protein [Streptosporangiaceae bacterium]|jgi:hypothetical protein
MASRKLLAASVPLLALLGLAGTLFPAAAASAGSAADSTTYLGHLQNWNLGVGGSPRCLGISGGKRDAPAVLWSCEDHTDQEWTVGKMLPNDYYRIYNGYGQCLGVSAGSTHNGARVVATRCINGDRDQEWQYGRGFGCGKTDRYSPIYNGKSGKVIGVSGNSTAEGAAIVIWSWVGPASCNNQYWEATGH